MDLAITTKMHRIRQWGVDKVNDFAWQSENECLSETDSDWKCVFVCVKILHEHVYIEQASQLLFVRISVSFRDDTAFVVC